VQPLADPGGGGTDRAGNGRAIDAGNNVVAHHILLIPAQWPPSSFSTSCGLLWTPKRSTMVAVAAFIPISSALAPSRRNLITALSSAAPAVISPRCAWVRSMPVLGSASLESVDR